MHHIIRNHGARRIAGADRLGAGGYAARSHRLRLPDAGHRLFHRGARRFLDPRYNSVVLEHLVPRRHWPTAQAFGIRTSSIRSKGCSRSATTILAAAPPMWSRDCWAVAGARLRPLVRGRHAAQLRLCPVRPPAPWPEHCRLQRLAPSSIAFALPVPGRISMRTGSPLRRTACHAGPLAVVRAPAPRRPCARSPSSPFGSSIAASILGFSRSIFWPRSRVALLLVRRPFEWTRWRANLAAERASAKLAAAGALLSAPSRSSTSSAITS